MNKFIKISFLFPLLFLVSSFCYANILNLKEVKITETSPFRQTAATNIFNGAMGLVGLKNLVTNTGIRSFATNLPSQVKQAFKDSKEIKTIIAAKYLDWKIATQSLSNVTDAEKQLITQQEKVWKAFGMTENVVNGTENLLASFPNIRKFLSNSRIKQYLNNSEYIGNDIVKKQLNSSYFQATITNAHPDVLKYMDEMDEFDFAEMVRGYRDLAKNNKFTTFETAIKSTDGFYGQYNGWFNYWKLTPGMKYSMTTIDDLRTAGKLLPTGQANDLQLAYVQIFTRKGDFINVPLRYDKVHFLGEFGQKGLDNIMQCLEEFRKIPERSIINERVFSGKTFSKAEFEAKFIGGTGKTIEYESFVSSSLKKEVAEGFIELTAQHAGAGEKIAVIQRIITKNGVYIDDISDWGKHLGTTRHSSSPVAIQIQEEVLMNPGSFKQTAEPIPIKNAQGEQIKIGGYPAFYLDLIEL
ncbi:hypothetical protein LIS90_12860 [Flavobacterium psychrophilum]|uniref:hypothetical protein n=1 Tax=Flavobacterium psychrophilum TaxID=96345 RepID=UPI000B7C0DB2|nr:hypothetical protein [Flavobacterium psychrophilum]MCB6232135.1 hypothetical protein [Flavobacterium psychrophilum]SNA80374.1 hypothetical protein FI146_350004 [Flavobacterium psychrophilum]